MVGFTKRASAAAVALIAAGVFWAGPVAAQIAWTRGDSGASVDSIGPGQTARVEFATGTGSEVTGGLSVTSAGGVGYTFDQDIGGTETTATGTLYNCPAPTTAVANCITVKSFTADLAGEGTISSGGHYRFQVNTAPTTGTARLSVTALQASTSIGGAAAGSGTPGGATGSVQTNAGGGSFGGLAPGADDTVIKASGGAWIVGAAPGGGGGLTDPGSNGMLSRTALNTTVARTITGDAEIVVMDGDGVSGNPTLSIGAGIARDSEVAAVELGDLANVTETGWLDNEVMVRLGGVYGGDSVQTDYIADDAITGPKVADNAVALGTQTTGGYAASATEGGDATGVATDGVGQLADIAAALKSGDDATLITGTAGTNGNPGVFNADGDLVDGGTPAGFDTTAIHDDTAGEIAAVTEKATPTTSDLLLLEDDADSDNKKRGTIGNILAAGTDLNPSGEVIGGSADDLDEDLDGNPEVSADGSEVCIDYDSDGVCEWTFDANGLAGEDLSATGNNMISVFGNDDAVTPDPTCANKGVAGKLTVIDVDETADDAWAHCLGTDTGSYVGERVLTYVADGLVEADGQQDAGTTRCLSNGGITAADTACERARSALTFDRPIVIRKTRYLCDYASAAAHDGDSWVIEYKFESDDGSTSDITNTFQMDFATADDDDWKTAAATDVASPASTTNLILQLEDYTDTGTDAGTNQMECLVELYIRDAA